MKDILDRKVNMGMRECYTYRVGKACLRLSDKILIFGNGDAKDTKSWQESETLSAYVQLLMDTNRFIASRVRDGKLLLVDKEIVGDLQFVRDEKE